MLARLSLILFLASPAAALDRYAPPGSTQDGYASWYGPGFHGRKTACGAIPGHTSLYNEWRMTAAHKTLRCGVSVQVTRHGYPPVILTITDRGPYIKGRIIDVSRAAAKTLGLLKSGVGRVTIRVLGKDE